MTHPFEKFLNEFIPFFEKKSTQLNKATWILETTGSSDAADLRADIDTELKVLLSDPTTYAQLLAWEKSGEITDPILCRQLNILIRSFKQNQVSPVLLEKIAQKESILSQQYAQFRPELNGKKVSENEIREVLKKEDVVEERKKAWEASKKIGEVLAPLIIELVELRNLAARSLGYTDFFQMQLELQEVDRARLLHTLDELAKRSESSYASVLKEIEQAQQKRFAVGSQALGPWAWSDPFCQEDPLDSRELDALVADVDIVEASVSFYDRMGIDVRPILARSDMWERPGKSQHAFCMNVDRKGDIRTLNNVQKSIKWLETVLHEFGHAIYDAGIDPKLPWLLKDPPHMITTEAMALLAGRQAYRKDSLPLLVGDLPKKQPLIEKADRSLRRRQLIFSRWAFVMTAFESELYRDVKQDLNRLWWSYVEKYQGVQPPEGREGKWDWATKYHIGLAPVYYFSYTIGEVFASAIQKSICAKGRASHIASREAGAFLQEKLFHPGNRMQWEDLVKHVTGRPLTLDPWLTEFS